MIGVSWVQGNVLEWTPHPRLCLEHEEEPWGSYPPVLCRGKKEASRKFPRTELDCELPVRLGLEGAEADTDKPSRTVTSRTGHTHIRGHTPFLTTTGQTHEVRRLPFSWAPLPQHPLREVA